MEQTAPNRGLADLPLMSAMDSLAQQKRQCNKLIGGKSQKKSYRHSKPRQPTNNHGKQRKDQLSRQHQRQCQRRHLKMSQISDTIACIGEKSGSTLTTISRVLKKQYGDDVGLTMQKLRRLILRGVKAGLITRTGHTNRFVIKTAASLRRQKRRTVYRLLYIEGRRSRRVRSSRNRRPRRYRRCSGSRRGRK